MKKLILVGTLILSNLVMADYTCLEQYQKTVQRKHEFRQTWSHEFKKDAEQSAKFAGVLITLSAIPVLAPFTLPVAALDVAGGFVSAGIHLAFELSDKHMGERQALEYEADPEMEKGYLKRTLRKAKKINPNIQAQDVATIIENGFESGDFCKNSNKLYKPKQIQAYVLERI